MKQNKRTLLTRTVACGLLLSLLTGTLLTIHATGTDSTLTAVDIKADDRQYSWLDAENQTYSYDFTSTNILTYSRDESLANVSLRTNMVFDGETLSCKDGKTFSFGSAVFLGDDYGIRGGELSFDLNQTGGKLSVGLRLSKKAADPTKRGIWFTFDGAGHVTVSSPESNLNTTTDGIPTAGRLIFRDAVDTIEMLIDETPILKLTYDSYNGAITVAKADGRVFGRVNSSTANAAGYFTLYADNMKGTIDNVTFNHVHLIRNDRVIGANAVDYSNWVAIDDRERETPTNETVGHIREDKQVGLFYFLNHTGSSSETPHDTTYLYNTLGLNGMKDYMSQKVNADSYYWAEPYFGYYLNTDDWVYRKHAYMLEAAGVDFIFVDLSNGATYDNGLRSLFDTWKAIRDEGGSTPEICILGAGSIGAVWNNVKGYIYSEEGVEKYGELFYRYEGKPLLLCDISKLSGDDRAEVEEFFTVRHCWAWSLTPGQWNWLQEYEIDENGKAVLSNGNWGLSPSGAKEELALCMGHHPTTSKGRSYVNSTLIYRDDYGFGLDSGAGLGFANSFEAVKQLDPKIMLITGWNEWSAGLQIENATDFAGTKKNPFFLVDQFNTEYSRDGEPMKLRDGDGVGFGDNYYYQMASYIREFKGWAASAPASGQITIDMSKTSTWANVGPLFTDNANDTAWRSEEGSFSGYTYVNGTGRNDLLTAKVSQDADYLYFMIQTAENVIISNDSDWMNLYINTDGDSTNGWEGFDFVLNRARDGHYVSVENLSEGWGGKHIGQALYAIDGDTMTIRLSKDVIGIDGTATEILFKWADNATVDGHIMEFMDKGDTAPNDRYAFRYTCEESSVGATQAINYKLSNYASLRDEATPLTDLPEISENESEFNESIGGSESESESASDESETERESVSSSESDSDSEVETSTESGTDAGLDSTTGDSADSTGVTDDDEGCASLVGSLIAVPVILAGAYMIRKRKE